MSDAGIRRSIRDGLAVYVAPENYFELRLLNSRVPSF